MLTLVATLLLAPKQTWTQKLPDGGTVTLAAVSNFAQKKSWDPDGTPQKTWVVPDLLRDLYNGSPSHSPALASIANFVVKLKSRNPDSQPTVAFRMGSRDLAFGYTLFDLKSKALWWAGAGVDSRKLPATIDLKVGVGTGKWKRASSHDLGSGFDKGPKFFGSIIRRPTKGPNQPANVVLEATIPKNVRGKLGYQIKVFDVDGNSLTPAGSGPMKAGGPLRYYFSDNGKRLTHADLFTQPYTWVTFKGVHTKSTKG